MMAAPVLAVGDKAPFCFGLTGAGVFYSFHDQTGRPAAVILAPSLETPGLAGLVEAFAGRLGDFAASEADVLLMVSQDAVTVCQRHLVSPAPVTTIAGNAEFFQRCGLAGDAIVVLALDRDQRVIGRFAPSHSSVAAALAAVAAVPREAQRDIVAPAPVLMVPYLLAPEQCRALIARHEAGGNFDSGFAGVDAAGAPQYKIDYAKKKRRDHLIAADDPMHAELRDVLLRRCAPEIKRAFQVEINHIDRLLIGRYDDDGCFFRRHRDNAQASLAFRQFAISVNLNAEDYDGGELLFPEYNSHRYRPGTGTGLIFSASLLHEAAPILRGSRYVLLSFLHSAEADARRRACLASAAPSGAVSAGAAPL